MLTMTSAPAPRWTMLGPSSYQMSSQTLTPTCTPLISNTGHSLPGWKYRSSSNTP